MKMPEEGKHCISISYLKMLFSPSIAIMGTWVQTVCGTVLPGMNIVQNCIKVQFCSERKLTMAHFY